ncbi:hypothetical protein EOM81_11510 [bacterium]|nr:hypothetical protein [bacterium]
MEKLNNMIETLAKFAREGRDNEMTRRLARNLSKIDVAIKTKKIAEADLAPVIAKQSIQSAVETSSALVANIEKLAMMKDLATRPASLANEMYLAQWQEDI